MGQPTYPGLFDRVKAVTIDSIILIIFMIIITDIFSMLENVADQARIIAFICIFLLYDPICTSVFGGTIGHLLIGIRVKKEHDRQKNILFPVALLRYLIKVSLGWISLLSVMGNEKRQAIHDAIIKSVVIYKR